MILNDAPPVCGVRPHLGGAGANARRIDLEPHVENTVAAIEHPIHLFNMSFGGVARRGQFRHGIAAIT